ncbi:iron chelate uptake ABC transporter family permease subunit, partial [Nocardia gipuzkoensis]
MRSPQATDASPKPAAPHRVGAVAWRVVVPVGLTVALAAAMVMAIGVGTVAVSPGTVVQVLVDHVSGGQSADPLADQIVWQFRAPRVALAALVGAALALAGVCLQTLVRNPLADPYLFGVTSGASLGAVL